MQLVYKGKWIKPQGSRFADIATEMSLQVTTNWEFLWKLIK